MKDLQAFPIKQAHKASGSLHIQSVLSDPFLLLFIGTSIGFLMLKRCVYKGESNTCFVNAQAQAFRRKFVCALNQICSASFSCLFHQLYHLFNKK